jgi:serine/threonine-protein kinase
MTMLGRALVAQKRFEEAVVLLTKALTIREAVYGPVHPAVASTLNELGNTALARERYGEAETAFSRMVAIYKAVYHNRHYLIGIAQSNLASVYTARKEYARGEKLYREVLAGYAGVLEPGHVNVGITHIKLGRALLRQRRFSEAVQETGKGYDILIRQTDPAVSFLRAARTDLALGYDSLGQPDKAARYRRELAESEKKG